MLHNTSVVYSEIMTIALAALLSILEGITEFLPVSSTGHLILASTVLGIPQTDTVKSFELFIQLGAILAVLALYYQRILHDRKIWKPVALAFLPTGIIGLTLYTLIKSFLLGNPWVTIIALGIGGLVLIIFERWYPGAKKHTSSQETGHMNISPIQALWIGIGQSVAIIPGISRSAATIVTGMMTGLSRTQAVEFSFFLAIPTMVFATGYDLLKTVNQMSIADLPVFAVGFVGSFLTAWVTIRWFLRYVARHTFVLFGIYRIVLALVYLLLMR